MTVTDLFGKSILVTGGTGSFGRAFCELALASGIHRLIIYSRDEDKHKRLLADLPDARLECFVGDVRDSGRLRRALEAGLDAVVHAAAMKDVVIAEKNPIEAVLTNIMGARSLIEAAIDARVPKVLALSTDKACDPCTLYGATKLVAEKLFTQGNAYAGSGMTRFACLRYGNVSDSRGGVLEVWRRKMCAGQMIEITDPNATRFWMRLSDSARLAAECLHILLGGEVFVPEIPALRLGDLADAIGGSTRRIGLRVGEKLHETLVSRHEAGRALRLADGNGLMVIEPAVRTWERKAHVGDPLPVDFEMRSDTWPLRLSRQDLQEILEAERLAEMH